MEKILPPRLAAASTLIPEGCGVADVGTDHGLLPVWLARRGKNSPVIASDLRPGPLSRAMENAARFGVSDRIRFVCADGLSGVKPGEVRCVVCCGMGGETIRDILLAAPWLRTSGTTLVLQPQSKLAELIPVLSAQGWNLADALLAEDTKRIYPVFSAVWTGKEAGWNEESLIRRIAERGDLLLHRWLKGKIRRAERALSGAEQGRAAEEETEKLRRELQRLRRAMEEWDS